MKKNINEKNKRKLFLVLFLLTLLVPIASISVLIFYADAQNEIGKGIDYNYFFYSKIVLSFLPIPVLSFVLGLISIKKGFKNATKNIISSIIVIILLLRITSFSNEIQNIIIDYNNVLLYQDILGVRLPDNGYVRKREANDLTLKNRRRNESITDVYYKNILVEQLENDILFNSNWIESLNYDYENMDILNYYYYKMNNVYILIYNETTNEYNTQPKEKGEYKVILAAYKLYSKHLTIHKYTYLYE